MNNLSSCNLFDDTYVLMDKKYFQQFQSSWDVLLVSFNFLGNKVIKKERKLNKYINTIDYQIYIGSKVIGLSIWYNYFTKEFINLGYNIRKGEVFLEYSSKTNKEPHNVLANLQKSLLEMVR